MLFEVGKTYTRYQIHSALGGELQTYLPQRAGKIVCGCFKPTLDSKAPDEVLVEDSPKVKQKAEMLCQQGSAIPVFLKLHRARWKYMGMFRVKKHSVDLEEIRRKQQESGRKNIAAVLYLEPALSELCSTVQITKYRVIELV
ncbi:MAG: hypothetical protein AB1861_10220 [Cyanobacteriota bacterium]